MPQRRSTIFLGIALAAALVLAGLYGLTWWYISEQNAEITQGRNTIAELQSAKIHSASEVALIKSTAADRSKVAGFFLSVDSVADFLAKIEALGTQSGVDVNIRSVTDDLSQSEVNNPPLRVALDAEGSWNATYRFLSLLERIPYAISLDKVLMEKAEQIDPVTLKSTGVHWRVTLEFLIQKQ